MDRVLNEIAALTLDKLGAKHARIHDGGVEANFGAAGRIRIEIRRI